MTELSVTIYEVTPALIARCPLNSFLHLAVCSPVIWCLTPYLKFSERGGFIFVHFNGTLNKRVLNRISKDCCEKYKTSVSSVVERNVIMKDEKIQKTQLKCSFSKNIRNRE